MKNINPIILVIGHKNQLFKHAARKALVNDLHAGQFLGCLYDELIDVIHSNKNGEGYFHRYIALAFHRFKPIGIFYIKSNGLLVDKLFEIQIFVKPEFRKKGVTNKLLHSILNKTDIKTSQMYSRGAMMVECNHFFNKNGIQITYGKSIFDIAGVETKEIMRKIKDPDSLSKFLMDSWSTQSETFKEVLVTN